MEQVSQAPAQDAPAVDAPGLSNFVFSLFFIFGGITSLNDVIIPKLKELFTLSIGSLIVNYLMQGHVLASVVR